MFLSGADLLAEAVKAGKRVKRVWVNARCRVNLPPGLKVKEGLPHFYRKRVRDGVVFEVDVEESEVELLEALLAQSRGLIFAADRVLDPRNLGSLFRTACAAGFSCGLLPSRRSASVNETVVEVSRGGVFHVPFFVFNNFSANLERLKERDWWLVGLDPHDGEIYRGFDFPSKTVLVVGGEEKGISPPVRDVLDYKVRIPMERGFDSLNLGVAFGIVAFEARFSIFSRLI